MKTKWETLLKDKRFRPLSPLKKFDKRNPFDNDYARLISSPPVRRLQDKSQVFPLEQSDFIRTRLTHSLEVSSIGQSIGKSIESYLINKKYLDERYSGYISSLLAAAGLVHDLGNPPFGHFGEEAIKSFFNEYFSNKKNCKGWSNQEMKDFRNFDGNVQTFRILRRLSFLIDENSYNLSYPTLASIIKYPRNSLTGNKKEPNDIADKKFGYFITEAEDYEEISSELKLNHKRHPIVYLLEAADDIAYSAADIEDGVKIGILDYEKIFETFKNHLGGKHSSIIELKKIYDKNKIMGQNRLDLTVRRFRIHTQSVMIEKIFNTFSRNYDEIISGEYKFELIKHCEAKEIRSAYKDLGKIVYCNKSIMEAELAGWKVVKGLLSEFIMASKTDNFNEESNSHEGRLYKLISSSYRYLYENYFSKINGNVQYKKFQLVVDFISGMTDTYSLTLFQKLTGIKVY